MIFRGCLHSVRLNFSSDLMDSVNEKNKRQRYVTIELSFLYLEQHVKKKGVHHWDLPGNNMIEKVRWNT
jgi:hypothetical protein